MTFDYPIKNPNTWLANSIPYKQGPQEAKSQKRANTTHTQKLSWFGDKQDRIQKWSVHSLFNETVDISMEQKIIKS